jgi:hypothetical protein
MHTTQSLTARSASTAAPQSVDAAGVLGGLFLHLMPRAVLFRYSCTECFRSLWARSGDGEAVPHCGCWTTHAPPFYARQQSAATEEPEVFVILYDGIPHRYARPRGIPNIHLDTVFSPVALYLLLAKKAVSAGASAPRCIVVDPHGRADKSTLALARLLAPHLQFIDGRCRSVIDSVLTPARER